VTPTQFDPAAHPPLNDLGGRLRELAGDAAYKAGRDYLRKGRVQDAAVAETAAYATVKGSTEYRVTVAFPSVETTKVTCTCPAHRRNKYCKHVVAVCTALVEQPAAFSVIDALPEPPSVKKSAPRKRGAAAAAKVDPAEMRAAGLGVLDRLLTELADGGLAQLGPEKAALIEQCAELVRALKLRRLGNLLMQLQRAIADPGVLAAPNLRALLAAAPAPIPGNLAAAIQNRRGDPDAGRGAAFARLLLDLYLCRAATGAHLEGKVALDPRLAEDLVGKTWRAEELEPVAGLELVQVALTHENDGEFVVETSYLVDLASAEIYAERQITPARLRSAPPKAHHRVRLVVEEAGLYPGLAPRRIRLGRARRAPLRVEDVERLVAGAATDLAEVQRRLVERAAVPFGRPEVAVLFRPAMLLAPPWHGKNVDPRTPERAALPVDETVGALDGAGRFLTVTLFGFSADGLAAATAAGEPFALFGIATLRESGLTLRCQSVVGAIPPGASRGASGRIYPEQG
jgi:hypothetical protein